MIQIRASTEWRTAYPGAIIGLLELTGLDNTRISAELDQHKRETEKRMRRDYAGFNRKDFLNLPVMAVYDTYYKHFGKTFHVQLQVESIVFKGKNLPGISPLVDASFSAEIDTFLLTAGHDAETLFEPVGIDISYPGDTITLSNGEIKPIRPGDMVMRDGYGVCCSILYGQDKRSLISPSTRHVLYVTYAPPGISAEAVEVHLKHIQEHIHLFASRAKMEQFQLLTA